MEQSDAHLHAVHIFGAFVIQTIVRGIGDEIWDGDATGWGFGKGDYCVVWQGFATDVNPKEGVDDLDDLDLNAFIGMR